LEVAGDSGAAEAAADDEDVEGSQGPEVSGEFRSLSS
jgi:hypothetical protein